MVVAGRTLLGSGESDNCEKDDALHDDDCNNGRGKMSTKSAHGLSCRPTEEKRKREKKELCFSPCSTSVVCVLGTTVLSA